MESEELDYSMDSVGNGEDSQPLWENKNDNDCERSEKTRTLFDGCCIKYLKTSECNYVPCPLSHKVGNLMIDMKYNRPISDSSGDHYDLQLKIIQWQLKILQDFLLDAPRPPMSLIKDACCAFASYKATDAIISMSKLLTIQYAQSNSYYMQFIFIELLYSLRQIYRSEDTAVAEILEYVCKECITPGCCEVKILDNIVKTIERSVQIDDKLRVFKPLIALKCYVFPQTLLDSLFHYTMRQTQSWLRANYASFRMFASLLLRESQEEHFFRIWKSSPHFVVKLKSYLKQHHMFYRMLSRKLAKFSSDEQTRVTTVLSTNVHTVMSVMHKYTEEHVSLDGQCTKHVRTFVPQNTPAVSVYQRVETLNWNSKVDTTSYEICEERYSADTCSNTLRDDSCIKRVSAQCNKDSTINLEEKNVVVPLTSNDGECCSSPEYGLRPDDSSKTSSQPSLAEFEQEAFAVQQFLKVTNYHSLLNTLEKWQNSQYISDLTKHIYNVLVCMDTTKVCNSLQGLLTVAIQTGKLSMDLKRCLSSISVNLFFHMVLLDNWQHAYEIFKLTMKHDLPYFNCEVYVDGEYSSARRVLAFVEVCMVNKDFEQAVSLLVDYNILAVDNGQWCLQSTKQDKVLCSKLINVLMDKMIKNDLRLTYKFLMYIMEAQKDIKQPINLVKSYELLLRKLLDQLDESTALQLVKDMYAYHKVPIVYDTVLCRALVVLCVNNNEIDLARLLVNRGRFLGTYPANSSFFSATIKSDYTRHEMRVLVEEVLNEIEEQQMELLTTGGEIKSDLHFTIVEAANNKSTLPKLLLGVNTSVPDAKSRLISLLRLDFYPCLYVNTFQGDSPNVVVPRSLLTEYFSCNLQKASSQNDTKSSKSRTCTRKRNRISAKDKTIEKRSETYMKKKVR